MRRAVACLAVLILLVACGRAGRAAGGEPVDLQLVLAADVSRSIDDGEFELQRQGYVSALQDPRVISAIQGGSIGAIAITYVEWAGIGEQKVVVGWTVVRDGEGAAILADQIRKAPRSFYGHTSISDAIDFSMQYFEKSGAMSERRVIDVSGDGTNNSGRAVTSARDDANAKGVIVNGLAIINDNINFGYLAHTHPPGGLPNYYRENVIGGPGAFLLQVINFESFADAMVQKLVTEISAVPQKERKKFAAK
ncbi:MAG TPA: DUF1194 domain-containing protein [Stellaceae bacterium]|nr:DUF1194 domain-containing protein [Stellaceae bacterium]